MDSHTKNYYKYMEVDENTEELVNTIMKTKYRWKRLTCKNDITTINT